MKKGLFILLFISFYAHNAHALRVEHQFDVTVGLFDASKTSFSYTLNKNTYSVNSLVSTNGIFDNLYPFQAEYSSSGKITPQGLQTQSYKYKSQSRFNTRRKELIYNDKGEPIYRISAKNDKEKKVEIEQALSNKDTTDLQTIIAKLALQYNQVKFCDAKMEVFDGKRRFDVIFKDEGQEVLPQVANSPYFGKAAKCSMFIDKLGSQGDDLLWELTQDRPIYFWIMQDTQTKAPFIARILVKNTPLGKIEVTTSNITIKDK